jgi:3-oxoacyl-[acyl-carrier-protein] synthase-3
MQHYQMNADQVDLFICHQANLFILKQIARKIGFPLNKLPISLDRFGNTSVASIPLTIVDALTQRKDRNDVHLMLAGFGVGLTCGIVSVTMSPSACLPIIYTKKYTVYEGAESL